MQAFWITFTDGSKACCEGESEYHAKQIAEKLTGKKVGGGPHKDFTMVRIPYPAQPIIWQFECPVSGKTPLFCHAPEQCKGRTSCPQRRACTE